MPEDDDLSDEEKLKQISEELEEAFNKTFAGDDRDPTLLRPRPPIYYKMDAEHNVVPCSSAEFNEQFEHPETRWIGRTRLGPYTVSTVFLSINHGYGPEGPKFFETMIMSDKTEDTVFADFQVRYATYAEASEGHELVVTLVREGGLP